MGAWRGADKLFTICRFIFHKAMAKYVEDNEILLEMRKSLFGVAK